MKDGKTAIYIQPEKKTNEMNIEDTRIQKWVKCDVGANSTNGRGAVPILQLYLKRSMGSDEHDQTLTGDDNNQPAEMIESSGRAHKNTSIDTRRDIFRQVQVATPNRSF